MKKIKWLGLGALLTAALLLGLTACSAQEMQELQGTLKNVDTVSGNITLKLKDGTIKTYTLNNVSPESLFSGNVTQLTIGDNITVRINKHGQVTVPQLPYASAQGTVKALGTDTITITTGQNKDITLKLTANTLVFSGAFVKGSVADLAVGQKVQASYTTATLEAASIIISHTVKIASVRGTVKAVNAAANTVTVTSNNNTDVTLQLTGTTFIWVWAKWGATINDIKAGQKVQATYEKDSLKALYIYVDTFSNNKKFSDNTSNGWPWFNNKTTTHGPKL